MSLVLAVPFGVGAATVYGASIVVQHRTAQQHADEEGEASAAGLLRLVRNPIWLLAIVGDFVGFVLQIVALSAGPVVVIQPLVVLMLPVALGVSALLGWHRPRLGDYLGVLAVIAGLGVFLGLVGEPGSGHVPRSRFLGMVVLLVLVVGVALSLLITGRNRVVRGAVFGTVAGGYFGTLAVMVDAASNQVARHGVHGLVTSPRGLVPIASMALLAIGATILTQISFQIGTLAATLPANLAADPLMGVVLGVIVLHEHIPLTVGHLVAYSLCVVGVVVGAIRLAEPVMEDSAA